jgi:peroxiredoxin
MMHMGRFKFNGLAGVLIGILLASHPDEGYGQTILNSGAGIDSTYNARIRQAWNDVGQHFTLRNQGKATPADDPQPAYAREFFEYYTLHPQTSTGLDAAEAAFVMWANLGADKVMDQALPHIHTDSVLWGRILPYIGRAFWYHDRKTDYLVLLQRLIPVLSDSVSRSQVMLLLADYHRQEGDASTAHLYYERVAALRASTSHVQTATGWLYELNSLQVGQFAPDFTASDLQGQVITLSALRGHVIVLDFWATWCGPCLPELPYLKSIYETYGGKTVIIIGISLDRQAEALQQFITEQALGWPQIFEGIAHPRPLTERYNVQVIPRTIVIDQNGRIATKDVRGEALVEAVRQLVVPQE